jgi:CRISPR/Cas system-associated exonuclease Cas4 (RecB family)
MTFDINAFVDALRLKFEERYDPEWVMPTELSTCLRRSWYARKKGKNIIGENAVLGIAIHNTVQDVAKRFNCEVEKEIQGEIAGVKVRGRADLVCDDSVIEIKTTAIHDQRHYFQPVIYATLLKKDKAYMLYVDRNTANITFFQVDISFILPFAIERLKTYYSAVVENKLPQKEYSQACKYCVYKPLCDTDSY